MPICTLLKETMNMNLMLRMMMERIKDNLFLYSLILLAIYPFQVISNSRINYESNEESCKVYNFHPKPIEILPNNTYGLWPGLASKGDLVDGEVIPGFYEAMDLIWKNQHPPDCLKAKYLIAEGFHQGYGSELHIYGEALALAVDLGRVLLQHGGWTWRYRNNFCESRQKNSLDCYYHPWSNCTLQDAIQVGYMNNQFVSKLTANDIWNPSEDAKLKSLVIQHGNKGSWRTIAKEFGNKTPTQCGRRWKQLRESLKTVASSPHTNKPLHKAVFADDRAIADYEDFGYEFPFQRILDADFQNGHPKLKKTHGDRFPDEVLVMGQELLLEDKGRLFVPSAFTHMLTCYGMKREFQYLWWRAISVSYLIRPNLETQKLLDDHADSMLKHSDGQCISTYIRHGDKHIEMRLVPVAKYIEAVDQIWKMSEIPGMHDREKKIFYVASDNFDAIQRIKTWGASNNVYVRHSNISQLILSDRIKEVKQHDLERTTKKNREMEYFSYILHLAETIKCEVAICTVPSNYCRLIDELRTTVGGKANRFSVDLSTETCLHPPCIRPYGIASFRGEVKLGTLGKDVREPRWLLWR